MWNIQNVIDVQWDAGNAREADKHGMSQGAAEQVLFNDPLLLLIHQRHGSDDGRRLHISLTLRDHKRLIQVISARDMHRTERTRYEQET
jgi:uncharacterized DUF497 family protein